MFKEEKDFIENLNSVRRISTSFVIASATVKKARNGKDYLEFSLTDKSGQITARMFPNRNAHEIYDTINEKCIYQINGVVDEFPRNSQNFSIKIDDLQALEEDNYQLDDFIRTSSKDREELLDEIKNTVEEMENIYLKNLLNSFFTDPEFTQEFCTAPSAKVYHHNYVGGLLEHSVEVLQICRTMCHIFPQLDQDLLYTGAILHDVGKLKAYDYDLISIDISNEGKLLDHLFISAEMVKEKINILDMDMPEELQTQVLHLILSHHGAVRNGWGSPVDPKTPEAIALHHADDLDAKVKGSIQK
ncbi:MULTISPECIES: 3'-5' exoribonuclease YhaM family protein [Methanobacterium]|jgi:3'-5' exoribonuclease|uniref:Metal dependent phosphohydrolase n=1 Tax=Methanobacterium formicicum TaxID=2162 RepID=A0A090I7D4_METFO|nr:MULTISPECIES: HD domain-containing protein [Methanobacterium]MDH2659224.1 HD domain-containing protein [Methanobacterium formicicum]CEA14105.1 metal dependent phosphohydrolase [Methanobacterium formicicum]